MTDIFTRLKELWSKTTPGEWARKDNTVYPKSRPPGERDLHRIALCEHPHRPIDEWRHGEPDAEFIAFAHNCVPQMLAEVERLQRKEMELQGAGQLLQSENTAIKLRLDLAVKMGTDFVEAYEKAKQRIEKLERAYSHLQLVVDSCRFRCPPNCDCNLCKGRKEANQILEDGK